MKLIHNGQKGIGEVAPIPELSPEDVDRIPAKLHELAEIISHCSTLDQLQALDIDPSWPSVVFGMETAIRDLMKSECLFNVKFSRGEASIPVNGLVWMSEKKQMIKQIDDKLESGFKCIKIKVGAINFKEELEVLDYVRSKSKNVILRLDANGAFQTNEALTKLKELSQFDVHSIEQPIAPQQPKAMKIIIQKSSIPIALDEELIGVFGDKKKHSFKRFKSRFFSFEAFSPRWFFWVRGMDQFSIFKKKLIGGSPLIWSRILV